MHCTLNHNLVQYFCRGATYCISTVRQRSIWAYSGLDSHGQRKRCWLHSRADIKRHCC